MENNDVKRESDSKLGEIVDGPSMVSSSYMS